jgi:aryl-alcohol dehydrogenase-like predicted oxidoreductase
MKFRSFPGTSVNVSEIGFGLWTVSTGWWGKFTEGEAIALMHKAFDLGINLYDAARNCSPRPFRRGGMTS